MCKNNRIMKAFISLAMAFSLLLPTCAGAFDNESALVLQSLDIIDTVPVEDLRLDSSITRAEFTKVVIRILGYNSIESMEYEAHFKDVPSGHWAASYINMCAALGIFEGDGDGMFYPEQGIILQDAVKTVVTILGYKVIAQETGYPIGYISQASKLGLLKEISAGFEDVALRSDVFQLVYNALDVDKLTVSLSGDDSQTYTVTKGDTIRNHLMGMGDVFEGTGVVTANFETFLINSNPAIENDEVEIDGIIYKTGSSNANDYLGVRVDFAAYEDKKTGEYVLEYVLPNSSVDVLNIDSEDFESYNNSQITYYEGGTKSDKAAISASAVILYNNRPITDWAQFDVKNGDIKLIDNDNDNSYDVVFISDYISLPVESVDTTENFIKLKDSSLYNGVSTVLFDIYDDDVRNVAYDAKGAAIELTDIAEDSLISIFADGNREYMKIVTGNDKVTGVITQMSDEECVVDGETYSFEVRDTLSDDTIRAGDEVTLYLNFEGKVGYIELTENKTERYGYIIGAYTTGLDDATVYIATAGKMEKRVDNLDNDPESNNTVTVLVSSNSSVEELKPAKRYTIKDQYGNSFRTSDISKLPSGEVVKFRTNSNGELSEIVYPEILDAAADMTYNARDNVFGLGYSTPFGINDDTVVVCVPESKVGSLDDYLAEVEMENAQQYKVCGYDFDPSTSNVKLLMIEEEMDYESSGGIGVNTSIAIVQKVSRVLNDDGEPVTKLVLLTKELGVELSKTINAASYADESKISKLKAGDVIYYSQNSNRELVDFTSVISLGGKLNYTNTGEGTDSEIIYGRAYSLLSNQIDVLKNRRAYSFVIQTDEYNASEARTVYPHTTNSPPVFIYDKQARTISFGTLDSAHTAEISGGNCDDVFVYLKNNNVEGIVLVRNSDAGGNE